MFPVSTRIAGNLETLSICRDCEDIHPLVSGLYRSFKDTQNPSGLLRVRNFVSADTKHDSSSKIKYVNRDWLPARQIKNVQKGFHINPTNLVWLKD